MERRLEHRGCRIAYDLVGAGPPVLWIQGVGVSGRAWRPQTEALSKRYACLSFDNRGLLRSQPVGAPIRVEQMAEDARALMDAEGWESAHLVGHSLGGAIALALALEKRARVRSLALLCTFSGASTAAPLSARLLWLGLRSRLGTRRMRRRAFLALVSAPGAIARSETDAWCGRLADLFGHDLAEPPDVEGAQLSAMRAFDARARLGELAGVPALVVAAGHDPIAPPAAGRALAAGIPGARYVEVPDASHGLPITHAPLVNGLLEEHFGAAEAAG